MANPQHKKVKITPSTANNEDNISNFPDEILANILSFIPTKSAVATSILSKRWKDLWISIPNLDFGNFVPPISKYFKKKARFMNFVDRVLSVNNISSVRTVNLTCYYDLESPRVTALVSALARRDAEKFSVTLPISSPVRDRRVYLIDLSSRMYVMPDCFFRKNNLVDLRLGNVVLKIHSMVCFPSLKTIEFNRIHLVDEISMKNLLSGCPILRSLNMSRSPLDKIPTLYFCSSTLDVLHLEISADCFNCDFKVVIDGPNIRRLHISDWRATKYDIINLSSLVSATINVHYRLLELLRKISHIKELRANSSIIHCFQNLSPGDQPVFNNLTSLTLHAGNNQPIMPRLFYSMPSLVTFVITVGSKFVWYKPDDVPLCFLSCIEDIQIIGFKESNEIKGMIIYILKNAMVLKKLSIVSFGLDLALETLIRNALFTLPRGSGACQVNFENRRAAQ